LGARSAVSDQDEAATESGTAEFEKLAKLEAPEVLVRALDFLIASRVPSPNPPESLYHYTDASALVGITSEQQLWATNAVFMNDQSEVSHAAALLKALLSEDGDESGSNVLQGPDLAVNHMLQHLHSFVEIYVVSFCAEPDLLSQWRGYGSAGGYAIEFDGPRLLGLGPGKVELTQVIYDEDEQRRQLREFLKTWRAMLADVQCDEWQWFKASALLAMAFGVLAISFKNKAFAEEREWRLFYSRLRLPETLPEEYFSVDFRSRNGLVVPYVRMSPVPSGVPAEPGFLPIKGIRIGPNPYPNLAASGVWHLINERKMGTNVQVSNSTAPLRL
jgi:Protein of unknown function (DUF2971)